MDKNHREEVSDDELNILPMCEYLQDAFKDLHDEDKIMKN